MAEETRKDQQRIEEKKDELSEQDLNQAAGGGGSDITITKTTDKSSAAKPEFGRK